MEHLEICLFNINQHVPMALSKDVGTPPMDYHHCPHCLHNNYAQGVLCFSVHGIPVNCRKPSTSIIGNICVKLAMKRSYEIWGS